MGRPVTLSTTDASGGATFSSAWRPDSFITPFNIGVMIAVTGTVSVSLQATNDDPDSGSAVWTNDASIASKTANGVFSFTTPCRGIRFTQASGNGSARFVLVQAG